LEALVSGYHILLQKLKHIEIEQKTVPTGVETTSYMQVAVACTVRPPLKRLRHDTIIIQVLAQSSSKSSLIRPQSTVSS
jgi:hypothetical protein